MNSLKEMKQDLQQAVFELVHPEPNEPHEDTILSDDTLKMMEYDIAQVLRNYAEDILDIQICLNQSQLDNEARLEISGRLRL